MHRVVGAMDGAQQLHLLRVHQSMYCTQLDQTKVLQARCVELVLQHPWPETAAPAMLDTVRSNAQQQVAINELLRIQIALLERQPLTGLQGAFVQLAAATHLPAELEAQTTDAGLVRR